MENTPLVEQLTSGKNMISKTTTQSERENKNWPKKGIQEWISKITSPIHPGRNYFQ